MALNGTYYGYFEFQPWQHPGDRIITIFNVSLLPSRKQRQQGNQQEIENQGHIRSSLNTSQIPYLMTTTRTTRIVVTKEYDHVTSCFMTALFRCSLSGPNCHCELRSTCIVNSNPLVPTRGHWCIVLYCFQTFLLWPGLNLNGKPPGNLKAMG